MARSSSTSGTSRSTTRFPGAICRSSSSSSVGGLWALSSGFVFHLAGRTFAIPGHMGWAAVLYAGSASLLSYFVGRKLIGLNSERYAREADLRYGLMRVNEHVDAIALAG